MPEMAGVDPEMAWFDRHKQAALAQFASDWPTPEDRPQPENPPPPLEVTAWLRPRVPSPPPEKPELTGTARVVAIGIGVLVVLAIVGLMLYLAWN